MKKLLALVMAVLPFVGWTADVNETNIPIATIGAVTTNDYIRILTNCAVSMANGKTRLLKIGELLSLVPASTGGAQVWTNDGQFIFQTGKQPSNSAPFITRTSDGSVFQGTNSAAWGSLADPSIAIPFRSVIYDDQKSESDSLFYTASATNHAIDAYYQLRTYIDTGDTGKIDSLWEVDGVGGSDYAWVNIKGDISSGMTIDMLYHGSSVFTVNGDGDINTLKGVGYYWPSANGGAGSFLQDTNGSGGLRWVGPGFTGNLQVITNGTDTITMHFTNGLLMTLSAP